MHVVLAYNASRQQEGPGHTTVLLQRGPSWVRLGVCRANQSVQQKSGEDLVA